MVRETGPRPNGPEWLLKQTNELTEGEYVQSEGHLDEISEPEVAACGSRFYALSFDGGRGLRVANGSELWRVRVR